MKVAILSSLMSLLAGFPPCLCAQQASLDGLAINAVTRSPLPGVHISLISRGVGTNLAEPDDAYGAISDSAGHYSIANIRPGTYILEPKHNGYVYLREHNFSATPIVTLIPNQRNTGYQIVMTPETILKGRVIDEFGDPVQGASVRVVSADGAAPYGMAAMRDETDDRGEFRITGIPGKYYIEASVHPLQNSGAPEIRTDGSSTTAYATTYYPGALAKERAKVIEATPGQELAGLDIHVAHRRSLKIGGTVTGIRACDPAHINAAIRVIQNNGEAEDSTAVAADGRFVFAGLAPSEYSLQASCPSLDSRGDPLNSPVVTVTIENDDAAVNLALTAGEELPGSLRVEGDPPGQSAREKWTIRLTPAASHGTPAKGGRVAADGSFAIDGIIPGIYIPTLDPLPENGYIKSLLLGGAEVSGRYLDLSKGVDGATMKITVSRNGGQIMGAITGANGQRFMGRHLFVVLAEDPDVFSTWQTAISSDSTFTIHGIRPGKYRLFAVDPVQFGGLRNYEPLKTIAARAPKLEIKEGDRIAKNVTLSGPDDVNGQ